MKVDNYVGTLKSIEDGVSDMSVELTDISSMARLGAASKHSSTFSSPAKMWGGKTGTPSQALCWGGQGFRGFTKVSSKAQGKKKKAHEATQKSKVAAGKDNATPLLQDDDKYDVASKKPAVSKNSLDWKLPPEEKPKSFGPKAAPEALGTSLVLSKYL